MFQYKVIHNQKFEEEKFFNKKELGEILNLYPRVLILLHLRCIKYQQSGFPHLVNMRFHDS